jgi:DNA-binding transcriptional regulator YhcF (GntR family)
MVSEQIEKIEKKIGKFRAVRDDASSKIKDLEEKKESMVAAAILEAAKEKNLSINDVLNLISKEKKDKAVKEEIRNEVKEQA